MQPVIHSVWQQCEAADEDSVAVIQSRREYGIDASLSRCGLLKSGNNVRRLLKDATLSVDPDPVVALFTERSFEMVTGACGILANSAAYMPVDPTIPIERMRYMIVASQACLALADAACEALAREACAGTECMVLLIPAPSGMTSDDPAMATTGDSDNCPSGSQETESVTSVALAKVESGWESDVFCVMFTSGSTGRPKGVLLTQGGVANYIQVFNNIAGIDTLIGAQTARLLLVTSTMFVDHMQALWGGLTSGTLLSLASKEETLGPNPNLNPNLNPILNINPHPNWRRRSVAYRASSNDST